ncbi:MAG: hypothetical protein ACRERD_29300 [Candidatus Binatia bacterium]
MRKFVALASILFLVGVVLLLSSGSAVADVDNSTCAAADSVNVATCAEVLDLDGLGLDGLDGLLDLE